MKYLAIFLLGLALAATAQTAPKQCTKGEFLTVDGRCQQDRTGESSPAGDGCNTMTCMDPSCRSTIVTALFCMHGDGQASLTSGSTAYSLLPELPKIKCTKKLEGTITIRNGIPYQCVRKTPKI